MRCRLALAALLLSAACTNGRPPPSAPDPAPPIADGAPDSDGGKAQPTDGSADGPAATPKQAGAACLASEECGSGICEGKGCDDEQPGTCADAERMCTRDYAAYCSCSGENFGASGSCPGQRYSHKGNCEGTAVAETPVKQAPRVRQAEARVQGALDKDIIRRIVRAHINEVRYCYNQGLVKDPDLRGRVEVTFTIGATGEVSSAEVKATSLDDKDVGTCIAKAVERWKFPKPAGGGNVVVVYPFVLEPG